MSFRTAVLTAIVAISAVTAAQNTSAQNYPTKPIHLIVPYPAGGGTDFFARLVGQKMSELIGQPIVVENKPGAATNLGADFVAKSRMTARDLAAAVAAGAIPTVTLTELRRAPGMLLTKVVDAYVSRCPQPFKPISWPDDCRGVGEPARVRDRLEATAAICARLPTLHSERLAAEGYVARLTDRHKKRQCAED